VLAFEPGLNVISGASNTGKSFIVSAIDYMLGSQRPLRDVPEREGYDAILLTICSRDGQSYTLQRSVTGGDFLMREGKHIRPVRGEALRNENATTLKAKQTPNRDDSVSQFLLNLIDLQGKRLRRNKTGDTQLLSFRNLAHLIIVDEERIITQGSPLLTGQFVTKTSEQAVFKLLLTGLDDSALAPRPGANRTSREEAIERDIVVELVNDLAEELSDLAPDLLALPEQLEKLELSIRNARETLGARKENWTRVENERRSTWRMYEASRERGIEIAELLERFSLLESAYSSDLRRLEAIREAGSLLVAFEDGVCPICGTPPKAQKADLDDADVELVVNAANAEIEKIERTRRELQAAITALQSESKDVRLAERQYRLEFDRHQTEIDDAVSPLLAESQDTYSQLVEKRGQILRALALQERITRMQSRIEPTEIAASAPAGDNTFDDLQTGTIGRFCKKISSTFEEWGLYENPYVFFDRVSYDFVINDKPRGSNGKGIRALTHAAVSAALLKLSLEEDKPHPGFVILDTPLRAYQEPDGPEEMGLSTEIKWRFFANLASIDLAAQIIIIENDDPPGDIVPHMKYTHFSGDKGRGREGFLGEAGPFV
jgi:hypothetical protein